MAGIMDFLQAASNEAAVTVSAPVDGLAWLLRKAGIPIEQPIGGSDWMEARGLTRPVKQSAAQVAGATAGLLSPVAAAAKAPQIARGLLQAGDNLAAPRTLNTQRGIFMGDLSKTWDNAAAAKAAELEKAGADPRAIWQETGTFKGADGKWRQEIDDSGAKLRDYNYTPREAFWNAMQNASVGDGNHVAALSMRPYTDMSKRQLTDEYSRTGGLIVDAALSGDKSKAKQLAADRGGLDAMFGAMRDRSYGPASVYMKHGELGAAYPDVYKLHTRITDDVAPAKGQYMRGDHTVGEQVQLASKPRYSADKSTMLHELQHAIQQREGFARGGSPEGMMGLLSERAQLKAKFEAAVEQARTATDPIAKANAQQERQFYGLALGKMPKVDNAQEAYKRLAGEAEARAVQARMDLTPAQRRALFPLDSYDVSADQLIVRK